MADLSYVLTLLNDLDFKKVVFSVISDKAYRTSLEQIIDNYSLASITNSDVINIIDAFSEANPSLVFDKDLFVNSIWQQLCNIQSYKNAQIIKTSIYKIYDNEMTARVNDGRTTKDEYASMTQEVVSIVEKYISVNLYINIDEIELAKTLSKIDNAFSPFNVNSSLIFQQLNNEIGLSILRNDILISMVNSVGVIYEPILKEVITKNIVSTVDGSVLDTLIADFIDSTNIQISTNFTTTIKSQLLEDLNRFKEFDGDAVVPTTFSLTPESFNTGAVTIQEGEVNVSINIEPVQSAQLISVDSGDVTALNVDVSTVEKQINVDEFNVQAKIIDPKFNVKISGSNINGLSITQDDKWKVITNDGETAQWEDITNLIGAQFGFLKIVETLGERAAIPLTQRRVGMLVYVKSRDTYYKCESRDEDIWTIFKQGFYPHRLSRTVIYENVRLGHGDKGSDLRISDIKSTAINTLGVFEYLEKYADVEYANLISFKNIGYTQAELQFDGNTHILNPNSVFELPYDGTLRFKIKGVLNFVSAFITFDTECEIIQASCCDPIRHKYDMESIFDPYF